MKFYLKHITLSKHKNYTEKDKVFILNFSKSTKDLLRLSNIFTKDCIISTCETLIKKYFGYNTIIKINIMDQTWLDGVKDNINSIYFKFHLTGNKELQDKINNIIKYWTNWGMYERNYEKYEDLFQHLIPIEKEYTDINDIIKDMNNMFNEVYKEIK